MKSIIYFSIAIVFALTSLLPVLAVDTFSCASVTEIPQIECEALVALYNSTNGPGWSHNTNWLVTITPSNWFGVQIDSGHIVYLQLQSNELSGSIPPQLGDLASLTVLDLGVNYLTGNIPPELGKLTNLTRLYLWSNQLTGSIPAELGNLTNLIKLWLDHNQLSGSIPLQLADLASLTELDLSVNNLTGNIPPELGKLTKLADLYLYSNHLTGSIPTELGNLTSLNQLLLLDNQLSGSIPPELGNLTNLQVLALQNNQFTGDIPPSYINLINLYDPRQWHGIDGLDLDYNFLNIPPGYPNPGRPLDVFLSQKDPDWQLYQGFKQIISIGGGEFTSLDGRTNILIPAGALITDTTFTYIPQPAPQHSSARLVFANNSFELSAEASIGNPVTTFNLPLTITLTYTDTDIIGFPENALGLYYWNGLTSTWTDAVTTCPGGAYTRNLDGNILALPLCHLTEFGLFGVPLYNFLPVVRR
jgi:hypothetical protein